MHRDNFNRFKAYITSSLLELRASTASTLAENVSLREANKKLKFRVDVLKRSLIEEETISDKRAFRINILKNSLEEAENAQH
jgi:regulator of replication initiation timing